MGLFNSQEVIAWLELDKPSLHPCHIFFKLAIDLIEEESTLIIWEFLRELWNEWAIFLACCTLLAEILLLCNRLRKEVLFLTHKSAIDCIQVTLVLIFFHSASSSFCAYLEITLVASCCLLTRKSLIYKRWWSLN